MKRVAVLCPTRSRPESFARLAESIRATSSARLLVCLDDDTAASYGEVLGRTSGVSAHIRDRAGLVEKVNWLVEQEPDYDLYGIMPDDCVVMTPGWDDYALEMVEQYPYCVVSPYHNFGNHIDLPFVSRAWIEALGWYACPDCYHYCWPIITGLIGEMTAICHCPKDSFGIVYTENDVNRAWQVEDAQAFFEYVSLKLPVAVERIRQAMTRSEICP